MKSWRQAWRQKFLLTRSLCSSSFSRRRHFSWKLLVGGREASWVCRRYERKKSGVSKDVEVSANKWDECQAFKFGY